MARQINTTVSVSKCRYTTRALVEAVRPMVEELETRSMLAFVHPGILSTDADFTRMATKVAANQEPWLSGWNKLLSHPWTHLGMQPGPVETIFRGDTNNSYIIWSQAAQMTNLATIWKVTGDTRYADLAVDFLNAWSSVHKYVHGNTNVALALGLYGFEMANVAEIMRDYSGWSQVDQAKYKDYLNNVWVDGIHNYLGLAPYTQHWGTDPSHYWANWDLANIGALMAIGIYTDRQDLYNEALNYVYNGLGNGAFDKAIYYLHAGNLGQVQEAGRDMGHSSLDFALLGQICQMAWNQGDDLFSYKNNLVLSGVEYYAKYNMGNDVPYVTYQSHTAQGAGQTAIAGPQGFTRPMFELFYNHYVTMKGLSAPYTTQILMQKTRPEGDYGNGDHYSWGTLLFALDPDTSVHAPQNLVSYQKGTGNIELSWWGGANTTSFRIYRATNAAGPFTQIATALPTFTSYTDTNLPSGTYYYKVTGVAGATETAATNVIQASSGTPLFSQLDFNESTGSTASDSVGSLTGTLNGGASFVAGGKSGNALLLDGTNGYVNLPSGAIKDLADYTIATWVYLNGAPATWARIFDFGDGRGDWMFLTPKNGSGNMEFATGTTYNWNKQSITAPALATNQWVHVAVTFTNRLATLYVNGVAVGSNARMDFQPYHINGGMPNSWIGRSQYTADPYLNGKIDDFRVYSGALPPAQVYALATGNTAPTPPVAPASLTATAVPGNTVNLSWPSVSGAASYSLYRATSSSGPFVPIATLVNSLTYSDTGLSATLAAGTTYYYRVAAANAGGDSAGFAAASANALPPIPGAPSGLVAQSPTSTSSLLNWSAGTNAASYTVHRATAAGGPYTTIASGLTATTYTDTGLTTGTTYFYVITSVNAAGQSINSNETNITPSDLAVQLKFDEGSGTTAYDATGNNWPGTLVNGPIWNTTSKINGGLTLDGTDDYVSLAPGVVNGLSAITLSAWVNLSVLANWQRIFDFGTGTNNYMFLSPKNGASAKVRFAIRTPSITEQVIDGTAALPTGTWTHVAVTINGSVGTLYVNGVQVGQNTGMTLNPSSLGSTTQNYLGKSQFNDPYLNGQVDDFRIYNRALSSVQISSLVNTTRPSAPANLIATGGIGQASLTWSPVVGANGYSILRSTSASGPFVPVAAHVGVASYVDTGLAADAAAGTTYYYVVVAENAGGDSPYSTAASTLVKPSLPSAPQGVVATASTSGAIKLTWTAGSDATSYSVARAISADGPFTTIASNVTAATYTDTGLINGISYYYIVIAGNFSGVGSASDPAGATATDLVARLKFDNSAVDSTGHGNDGTLVNSPNWTTGGKVGSAISLSGSSQYVALPVGVVSSLTTATFASWVYLNSSTANQRIFDFGSGTGTNMFLTNAGGSSVRFAITTSGNGNEQSILGTAALPTGNWVHVAVTLNGSVGTLYVNGTQVGQKTNMTLTPSSLGNTTQNWLGRSQYAADAYLNGKLDDFRIYSRALSNNEIGKLVDATVPAIPSGVNATSGNAQVVLNWSAASGATSYTILRSDDNSTFGPVAASITGTTWTDTSVTNGATYQYQIIAVNAFDSSAPSATVNGAPNGIPATINGTSGPDSYYLRRNGSLLHVWLNDSATGTPDYSTNYASGNQLTFSALGGDDTLIIDNSAGESIPSAGISFDGGIGNDIVNIIGADDEDSFNINAIGQISQAGKTLAYSNAESLSLSAGNFAINANLNGIALQIAGSGTQATFTKSQTLNALSISSGANVTSASTDAALPAMVVGNVSINNATLAVAINGGKSGVSKFSSIAIAGNGRLDLHDNDLIIDYGAGSNPFNEIQDLIKSGLTLVGGNGYGIGSSDVDNQALPGTILGTLDNSAISGAITSLSSFTDFSANSVIIKFTWFGDSDLSGMIDGSDYALIDTGFTSGGSLTGWVFGDYDFNNIIDSSDYALIDTGFISQNTLL